MRWGYTVKWKTDSNYYIATTDVEFVFDPPKPKPMLAHPEITGKNQNKSEVYLQNDNNVDLASNLPKRGEGTSNEAQCKSDMLFNVD